MMAHDTHTGAAPPYRGQASSGAGKIRRLMRHVADRAMLYRYYHWDWGEAIAMEGLWLAAAITGVETYQRYIERMVHGWIAHSPDPWYPDHVGPGRVLVEMWRATQDASLLEYARALARHLSNLPRSRRGAFFNRPDLPDRAQSVWVDSMHTDGPFLCHLADVTGDAGWFSAAAEHVCGHVHTLQDPETHLFHHHYDDESGRCNGVFWARGNGWPLMFDRLVEIGVILGLAVRYPIAQFPLLCLTAAIVFSAFS